MKNLIRSIFFLTIFSAFLAAPIRVQSHCEVPCGIFTDSMRIDEILEHITTLEKSMNSINELSAEDNPNYNQLIRWVNNKDEHAVKIQDIMSQYFLHQRIKLTDPADTEKYAKYIAQLTHVHEILVYAMKAKQSTDLGVIANLRDAVAAFEAVYFEPHEHHDHKH